MSKYSKKWRDLFNINNDICGTCDGHTYSPIGLLQHCSSKSRQCAYHLTVLSYLNALYSKWWQFDIPGKPSDECKHYALTHDDQDKFKIAMMVHYKYGSSSNMMYNIDGLPQKMRNSVVESEYKQKHFNYQNPPPQVEDPLALFKRLHPPLMNRKIGNNYSTRKRKKNLTSSHTKSWKKAPYYKRPIVHLETENINDDNDFVVFDDNGIDESVSNDIRTETTSTTSKKLASSSPIPKKNKHPSFSTTESGSKHEINAVEETSALPKKHKIPSSSATASASKHKGNAVGESSASGGKNNHPSSSITASASKRKANTVGESSSSAATKENSASAGESLLLSPPTAVGVPIDSCKISPPEAASLTPSTSSREKGTVVFSTPVESSASASAVTAKCVKEATKDDNINQTASRSKPKSGKDEKRKYIELEEINLTNIHKVNGKYYISKDPDGSPKKQNDSRSEDTLTSTQWNRLKKQVTKKSNMLFNSEKFQHLKVYKDMKLFVKDIGPCNRGNFVEVTLRFIQCNFKEESIATVEDLQYILVTKLFGGIKIYIDGFSNFYRIVKGTEENNPTEIEIPAANFMTNDTYLSKKAKSNGGGNNSHNNNSSPKNKKRSSPYFSSNIQSEMLPKPKLIVLVAKSLDDNHSSAPILPPDVITLNKSVHKMTSQSEGQLWYNCLRHNNTRRRYVKGSYHDTMFGHKYSDIIDWRQTGDLDILVLLPDMGETRVKIRCAPVVLSDKIVNFNRLLRSKTPNCRGVRFGDSGKMFSMGKRSESLEYSISRKNRDIQEMMTSIGYERKKWFQDQFPDDYLEYFNTENQLDYMKTCLSDFMVHSINLRNASHYDVNDATITTTTWVEDEQDSTHNWYFVFPNVTRDMKKAIVVKLFHGCTINWNGAVLRHCSSLTTRLRGGDGTSAGNCELRRRRRR